MKICTKCKVEKEINDFYKNKRSLDGYNYSCKECDKLYYKINDDRVKSSAKLYRKLNTEKSKIYMKNYSKEKKRISSKKWREKNKEYFKNNRYKYQEKKKSYKKNYDILNREKLNKISRERYKNDILYRISIITKSSIKRLLLNKGNNRSVDILGCSYVEFKLYLESKFEFWMNWDNYGIYNGELKYGWDIDHIIPLSSAISEEEIIKLSHYTNLQPLCSKVNRYIKKNK